MASAQCYYLMPHKMSIVICYLILLQLKESFYSKGVMVVSMWPRKLLVLPLSTISRRAF